MNQGKLEVVEQEMARVNINILGIKELKWTGRGEFNSDDHYIYHCGQESLRRNGVTIIVNKRVRNAVLGCNLKNDRMISVRFQSFTQHASKFGKLSSGHRTGKGQVSLQSQRKAMPKNAQTTAQLYSSHTLAK